MTKNSVQGDHAVRIRPVKPQDKEQICALLRETANFNASDIDIGIEVLVEALDHPETSDYRILCAVSAGDVLAGYICYGPIPLTVGCFDLYWIAVAGAWMRSGIGEQLLEAMERSLIAEQARRVYVDTSSTNGYAPAHAFYEKHGYRIVAILEDFYRVGDHKKIYMKELTRPDQAS